ncbi:enoyl-CoA hydratase/isomerase family protein [Pedobacter antarcticus]|uniref:Enoyl-CoA hydratase n=2 Tax=Pedobacter antarcticus TaxID=34086 RepID=A0A081PGF5_9SPHI|nr:enoyl-CoA hydratase-related protein [Pedobacter antarcticus]KEQ29778.1 enoyl-CoA hydratase [Pedobacter antarcticus 4BY]SDM49361.1 enoyl-CoA hydratase [Pedobacter antarcticus]SFE68811.1 enoyl-CoA hydratase [Pedobacter antarcticus]
MNLKNILSEIRDGILYLTINRQEKLNALNKTTLAELAELVIYAGQQADVSAVLLTGAGEKAFVAGADISEFAGYNAAEGEELARNGQESVFNAIEHSSKPWIAAINGFALGGGLELAMACHIRLASENAKLGLPEVSLGLIPGYGGTQRLTALVGKGKALEMILTAGMITAAEAEKVGLVNQVVPQKELLTRAVSVIQLIQKRAPLAVAAAIRAVNAAGEDGINGFEMEITEFGRCFDTADFKEGSGAFTEKRQPEFKGN